MKKYELFRELTGCYLLKDLQYMGLVPLPDEDMTQEQIEDFWETSDGWYLLLVNEDECEKIYHELFDR